ncbi:ABC transporter ATP-binding protein [Rossellomorea vietnamensis]|uniref:ABC transporter ATP-binding protein n=1 Tax=Rossellomorea vietnamensis TaxID=218284 RepID=A0A5D4NNQ8_9BACI|nr:ABC transporter ATP-binding protein [Rossellomorea vietnamensis]TYS15016.1 ABC transporter ATP-binding protein [Rossellomorea vietnamensis]
MTDLLTLDRVSFSYTGGTKQSPGHVLDGLSLSIRQGEFVSIIGPSGSGKSTLFRLITGLENQTSGRILFHGEEIEHRLGQAGYMPQQDLLLPWRTVRENAILPLQLQGMKKEKACEEVGGLLKEFGLSGYEDRYPHNLSGGMRQRVSFLRAVLSGKDLLVLDEPFSALDAITKLSMQEWLLDQWSKWKKTILFITHDVEEALFLADRIFVFSTMPVSQLTEIKVPLPRPRDFRDLAHTDIQGLKTTLISELRKMVSHS